MNIRSMFTSHLLISLSIVIECGHVLGTKKDLAKSLGDKASLSDQNSHEAFHSKNDSHHLFTSTTTSVNFKDLRHNASISFSNDSVKYHPSQTSAPKETSTTALPVKHVQVVAEGGIGMNTFKHTNNNQFNNSLKNVSTSNKVHENITTVKPHLEVNDKPLHKRIHGRPGVSEFGNSTISIFSNKSSTVNVTVPPTTKLIVKKKKPLFTVATGDKETKESESFIESPTTGRDYVVPIVLTILSLPIVFYIIKVIYRRGTEFTERQQYHRMYLIDGMYNSR